MASNIPRALPFSSWDEWMLVKNGLYSSDVATVQNALQIVAVWRLRGRLPLSVDSTANLIELRIRDSCATTGHRLFSDNEMKLHFSAVVVRAVNGLVDPSQQGLYATSVLTLAEKIGLPGWIVELRHDATHNQMPSLSVLRNAASTLVNWLYECYWVLQMNLILSLSASSLPTAKVFIDEKNASSGETLIRNANTPDSSPTFVSEIFAPVFIGTTVHAAAVAPNSAGSRNSTKLTAQLALDREFQRQRGVWERRLGELLGTNSCAVHVLVAALLAAVRDVLRGGHHLHNSNCSNSSSSDRDSDGVRNVVRDTQLGLASLWLSYLLTPAAAAGGAASATAGQGSLRGGGSGGRASHGAMGITGRFINTLMTSITAAAGAEGHPSVEAMVQLAASYYPCPPSHTAAAAPGSSKEGVANSALGKRKSESEAKSGEGLYKGKAAALRGEVAVVDRIFIDTEFQPWPLGCSPGQSGCGDLHLVEDA